MRHPAHQADGNRSELTLFGSLTTLPHTMNVFAAKEQTGPGSSDFAAYGSSPPPQPPSPALTRS